MNIAGFQPLSLTDYPGILSSIVFTQGCPFRCAYCHNPELISTTTPASVSEDVVFDHLQKNRKMLEGVCITGGEPTIQAGLREFIERVKSMGFLVKLDTNGVHPRVVRSFLEAGIIDYVAMDLKNVWSRYVDVVRTGTDAVVKNCRETFQLIRDSGVAHEFRTTICPGVHTEEDFMEMGSYLRAGESWYIQETRLGNTLDPDLPSSIPFSVPNLVTQLKEAYPSVEIATR